MTEEYKPREWKAAVERVNNGVILEKNNAEAEIFETEDDYGSKPEGVVAFLYSLLEYFDFVGSRYDSKRIVVKIEHGDKVDCTDPNCEQCNG